MKISLPNFWAGPYNFLWNSSKYWGLWNEINKFLRPDSNIGPFNMPFKYQTNWLQNLGALGFSKIMFRRRDWDSCADCNYTHEPNFRTVELWQAIILTRNNMFWWDKNQLVALAPLYLETQKLNAEAAGLNYNTGIMIIISWILSNMPLVSAYGVPILSVNCLIWSHDCKMAQQFDLQSKYSAIDMLSADVKHC